MTKSKICPVCTRERHTITRKGIEQCELCMYPVGKDWDIIKDN